MALSPICKLRETGTPVDLLNEEQRGVIESLTPEEAEVIISVNQRLAAVGAPEVEGHIVVGAGIF